MMTESGEYLARIVRTNSGAITAVGPFLSVLTHPDSGILQETRELERAARFNTWDAASWEARQYNYAANSGNANPTEWIEFCSVVRIPKEA